MSSSTSSNCGATEKQLDRTAQCMFCKCQLVCTIV